MIRSNKLKIINIDLKFKNSFNVSKMSASKFVQKSLNLAHYYAINSNEIQGIINCPVNKEIFKKTKLVLLNIWLKKCNVKDGSEAMLIHNKKLSVSPITIHIDVKQISNSLYQR